MTLALRSMATGIRPIIACLNQPLVKDGIKQMAGAAAFAFGLYEIYDDVKLVSAEWRQRASPISSDKIEFSWVKTAAKVLLVISKISLLLSCFTSQPGLILCGWIVGSFLSPPRLQNLFGPNTIFAVNPYHPRHLANLAAFILGLPALMKSVYDAGVWMKRSVCHLRHIPQPQADEDKRVYRFQMLATINTLFSRTMLHFMNGILSRSLLRH